MLEYTSLLDVAALVPRTPFAEALRSSSAGRSILQFPPDRARRDPLLAEVCARASHGEWSSLPTHFSVAADDELLARLASALPGHVRSLTIGRGKFEWRFVVWINAAIIKVLSGFTNLMTLSIELKHNSYHGNIDLQQLSKCAPRLETLSIIGCPCVTNTLRLMQLKTLTLLNTSVDSIAIAVHLHQLKSLTIIPELGAPVRDIEVLQQLNPLRHLAPGRSELMSCSDSILGRHLPSLDVLWSVDETNPTFEGDALPLVQTLCERASASRIRSLKVSTHALLDLSPLTCLHSLELLQVTVHEHARDCLALQQLTSLRTLHIHQGWLQDIMGCLPRLKTLVCTDGLRNNVPYIHERAVLGYPRHRSQPQARILANAAQLEGLGLYGKFLVRVEATIELLTNVQAYAVACSCEGVAGLLMHLPRLRRAWFDCLSRSKVLEDVPSFASLSSLRELSLSSRAVPAWQHHASALRRYANLELETLPAQWPPALTHVAIPSVRTSDVISGLRSLKNQRIVSIARDVDCKIFRRERHPAGALPLLECIYHPAEHCLAFRCCPTFAFLATLWCPRWVDKLELRSSETQFLE